MPPNPPEICGLRVFTRTVRAITINPYMRRAITIALAALCLWALPLAAGGADSQQDRALQAAQAWLALVDRADWAGSYTAAHPNLRTTTDRAAWDYRLKELRGDLGDIKGRKLVKSEFSGDRPQAPREPFYAFVFDTETGKAGRVEESLTCRLDPAGVWRVSGYFIDLKL